MKEFAPIKPTICHKIETEWTKIVPTEKEMTPERYKAEWAEYDKMIAERESTYIISERDEYFRQKSDVPDKYQNESFASYKTENEQQLEVVKKMREYESDLIAGKFRTICMLGIFGAGKTHLACALLHDMCRRVRCQVLGFDCFYSVHYVLSDAIREEYEAAKRFDSREMQNEVIERYGNYDILVIDEIGVSSKSELEKEVLYRIINERYVNRKSSILISNNMDKMKFENYIGGAAVDRLKTSAVYPNFKGISSWRPNEWA
jgi:DNA replication protein DnaC